MTAGQVVIVGAGLAGAAAAHELRRLGHDGPVTLIGAEVHAPYERPPLSKAYLAGTIAPDRLDVYPGVTYDELGVTLRTGVGATGLSTDRREVQLDDGDAIGYDILIVATGSANLRPPIPGLDLPGVHQLRTRDEADALRDAASTASQAVLVGTGLVGSETAATLRTLGLTVTAVDALPGPLWAQTTPMLSDRVRSWHTGHGVQLLSASVAALEGAGQVEAVRLTDGTVLPADLVVVGVGARPDVRWLADSGVLLAAGGVAVDAGGRSSDPRVLAAGDVAAVWREQAGSHLRVEHYNAARAQGQRVAYAAMGLAAPDEDPSWWWTEQYEHVLHVAGEIHPDDDVIVRPGGALVCYLRLGVLQAVAALDNGREFRRALALLGRAVDPELLKTAGTALPKAG